MKIWGIYSIIAKIFHNNIESGKRTKIYIYISVLCIVYIELIIPFYFVQNPLYVIKHKFYLNNNLIFGLKKKLLIFLKIYYNNLNLTNYNIIIT